MMIVMIACPSLIRNSTPLIKGPGAPVLMAAGPFQELDSRRGEARRHPWHTPVDRATKQKRVILAPPPLLPIVVSMGPSDKTNPVTLPYPTTPPQIDKNPQYTQELLSIYPPSGLPIS
ncbi:hypothetical protein ILYODFUR_011450 [Ilyodon furcidens]|uniref:Uncharacterized protein n=1 Tax=Ilyodon furcidens TaxID=33524 RepID=A0ABV0SWG0_9TELE